MGSATLFQQNGNRRSAARVKQNLKVEFYGDDMQTSSGMTLNVSATGARILTRATEVGDILHVRIDLGGPLGGREVLALADRVWQNTNEATGFTVVGLKFTAVAPGDDQTLTHFCNYHSRDSAPVVEREALAV